MDNVNGMKPCPFCGEEECLEVHVNYFKPGIETGYVECRNCGARGQEQYGSLEPNDMIEFVKYGWNERIAND